MIQSDSVSHSNEIRSLNEVEGGTKDELLTQKFWWLAFEDKLLKTLNF